MAKKSVKRQRKGAISCSKGKEKEKTLRQSRIMLTPVEYLKRSNTAIFCNDLLSNGTINSISLDKFRKNNLTNLDASSADLNAFEYSQPIQDLLDNDVLNYENDQNIIDSMLKTNYNFYCDKLNISKLSYTHANILKFLKDNLIPGANVLDVGSGTGTLSVIFANMVNVRGLDNKPRGSVTGIDISKEVLTLSLNNITNDILNSDLLNETNFKIVEENGKYGYPIKSNNQIYDVINIGALIKKDYAPKYLKAQLKEGGLMLLPFEMPDGGQIIRIYQRIDGKIKYTNYDFQVDYCELKQSIS
jgi:protein-L-isoaspartate O-methyltransferase